ncbi:hypothetical protein BCON_0307g00010 [Botryotinia convoluta]|uniref:Clr5 domain-containing protein n=1 Tax=Botryotinia convoluta TaxID=54673 RepID=A0A4Z1HJ45_9HELO|nr:hypothetical protein BCON_0307g00010 [Botryotinia convoluta]
MDYSKTFSLGTSTNVIDGFKALESRCFALEVPNCHSHRGGRVITDADWPGLKPIIHRLYIIDNLAFLKVKEALNLEFGYNITNRQFTRKIETWGFKKNFRKNERDEIVKSGKIPHRLIHGSRINQKRVERLQRRNVVRMGFGVESEDNERSLVQDQDFFQKTNAIKGASLDLELCYTMTGDQNAALEDYDMTIEEIPRSKFRHGIVTQNTEDQWPFIQSAEDDSGLSWLAELFVQLEIAEIIASISFETKKEKQWDVEEARFISGTDLKELSKPYDNTSKDIDGFEGKLPRLERVLPPNSPAIILTLESLAFVYHRLGRRGEVRRTHRNLFQIRQKEKFPNTYKKVESYLWIVDSSISLGDMKIAMNLHSILHPEIEKAVDSQHPLRIYSSYLMAKILYQLYQNHEAEDIIRPVMQIVLATLGHNHILTIKVMNLLSLILQKKFYLVEANRLARYSLQVADRADLGATWFESARTLIYALEAQDLYNESTSLSHHLYKLSSETFDCKEHAYLAHHMTIATALLERNEASKAVDMLREVQNNLYAYKEQKISMEFKLLLGCALLEQRSFEEAIVCLKESFKLTVELYGWDDPVFYKNLSRKWRMLVEKESSTKEWVKDIEDRIHEVRGGTRGDDESIFKDDDDEKHETDFGDTDMEGFDIREEENDAETQFEGRGPSLDDIFNTERDTSEDITFVGLGIDKHILA